MSLRLHSIGLPCRVARRPSTRSLPVMRCFCKSITFYRTQLSHLFALDLAESHVELIDSFTMPDRLAGLKQWTDGYRMWRERKVP